MKCDCYYEYPDGYKGMYGNRGVCYGTKECDPCSCGGDKSKCDFYPERRKGTCKWCVHVTTPVSESFYWCKRNPDRGTKCPFDGDYSKCNDIAEVEKMGVMKTADMYLAAQADGKTYITGDMAYSAKEGLFDPDNGKKWPMDAFGSFKELMEYEWSELKIMTKREAELSLGVRIVD